MFHKYSTSRRAAEQFGVDDLQSDDALRNPTSIHVQNQEIKFLDTLKEKKSTNAEKNSVALCLAITTRKRKIVEEPSLSDDVTDTPFFLDLMPSFCATASKAYKYTFYLAFDFDDSLLSRRDQLNMFVEYFNLIKDKKCKHLSYVGLNFVNCSHSRRPAWAQNDAMMSAYLDNNDYLYRVNDDARMTTKQWTEIFIKTLSSYDPPNIGVVGPNHTGGNLDILTFEFVHQSHIDIFGFHYPRDFWDWFADKWITYVYQPRWMTKLNTVLMEHHIGLSGSRYHQSLRRMKHYLKDIYQTGTRNI